MVKPAFRVNVTTIAFFESWNLRRWLNISDSRNATANQEAHCPHLTDDESAITTAILNDEQQQAL